MSERPRIELTTMPDTRDRRSMLRLLAFFGVFSLIVLYFLQKSLPDNLWAYSWDSIGARVLSSRDTYVYLLLSILGGWTFILATRQRLVFDEQGIHYSTLAPAFLKFAQRDWSYQWSDIERVSHAHASIEYPAQAFVVVKARNAEHRVQILSWRRVEKDISPVQVAPARLAWRMAMFDWKMKSQKQVMADRLADSELLKAFAAYGITIDEKAPSFDWLAKTKTGVGIFVVTISAMLYAMAEMLLGPEAYATGAPWLWIAVVALGGAVAGFAIADSFNLRLAEKIALPILLAGALGAASYPGIIRVNTLLDPEPAITVNYRQGADMRLYPENDVFPSLRIERYDWYWRKFDSGQLHELTVRRGGLGIWTYNAVELRKQIQQRD